MSLSAAKVCLVGDFGVGKTSLVNRFVKQAFDERYQTTVGVTIETLQLELDDERELKLIIWDIAGSNIIDTVKKNYLRGASGLVFVADGTRQDTFATVLELQAQARDILNDPPCVFLLNKSDLTDHWELDPDAVEELRAEWPVFNTSARTGEQVEAGFLELAQRILG